MAPSFSSSLPSAPLCAPNRDYGHKPRDRRSLLPSDPFLSYHSIRLAVSEVQDVKDHNWLPDLIIAFWQEHVTYSILRGVSNVVLVKPSQACILQKSSNVGTRSVHLPLFQPLTYLPLSPQPSEDRSFLPDFTNCTHAFLPVNNCDSHDREGGSHWSLVLISVLDEKAIHYDSCNGMNARHAERLTRPAEALLGIKLDFVAVAGSYAAAAVCCD